MCYVAHRGARCPTFFINNGYKEAIWRRFNVLKGIDNKCGKPLMTFTAMEFTREFVGVTRSRFLRTFLWGGDLNFLVGKGEQLQNGNFSGKGKATGRNLSGSRVGLCSEMTGRARGCIVYPKIGVV